MGEEETIEAYEQFIAHGQDAFADTREALVDALDAVGTVTGSVILLGRMVHRISERGRLGIFD